MSAAVWVVSQPAPKPVLSSRETIAWFPISKLADAQELAARGEDRAIHVGVLDGSMEYRNDIAMGPETILVKC